MVQNGDELGLTKYREAAYPPPMFGYTVANVFAHAACIASDDVLFKFDQHSIIKCVSKELEG